MNILYLHGLDSKLNPEKRAILEKFGTVYAPNLNYYDNPDAIESILKMYPGEEIDCVIGSSMGGFAGYYVSGILSCPALLFNPALKERSVPQHFPEQKEIDGNFKQIVLGQQDEVVDPKGSLEFITRHSGPATNLHLHLVPGLGHRIPLQVFEEEAGAFFRTL